MKFTQLDLLYYIVPCFLLVLFVRWRGRNHYLGYSRLVEWRNYFSRAGKLVYLPLFLQWAAFGCLLVAVLNPILSFAEQEIQFTGLDIVLTTDLSASMQQALPIDAVEAAKYVRKDSFFSPLGLNPSRLDAVKIAVKNFIRQRRNDRMGLVVFSSNAYVVSPMTLDYDYLSGYIDMMDHRTLVGEGMTPSARGVYVGTNLVLKQNEGGQEDSGDQLLIVLTDGENNYGRSPIQAVEYAREKGLKIYLIGVDVPSSSLTNRLIAAVKSAGGTYYDVRNQEQLNDAYWEIGALERGGVCRQQYHRSVPLYHQAVFACVVCLALALSLRGFSYFTDLS